MFYLVLDVSTGNIVERRQLTDGFPPPDKRGRRWVKCTMEQFGDVMKTNRWDRLDESLVPIRDRTVENDEKVDGRRQLTLGPVRERTTIEA